MQIVNKLTAFAQKLEAKGFISLAHRVDAANNTFIKTAKEVGVQGYWVQNGRCWQGCYRSKRESKPKTAAQEIWMECLEEYQKNIRGKGDWNKYAGSETPIKTAESQTFATEVNAKVQSGMDAGTSIFSTLNNKVAYARAQSIEAVDEMGSISDALMEIDLDLSKEAAEHTNEMIKEAQMWNAVKNFLNPGRNTLNRRLAPKNMTNVDNLSVLVDQLENTLQGYRTQKNKFQAALKAVPVGSIPDYLRTSLEKGSQQLSDKSLADMKSKLSQYKTEQAAQKQPQNPQQPANSQPAQTKQTPTNMQNPPMNGAEDAALNGPQVPNFDTFAQKWNALSDVLKKQFLSQAKVAAKSKLFDLSKTAQTRERRKINVHNDEDEHEVPRHQRTLDEVEDPNKVGLEEPDAADAFLKSVQPLPNPKEQNDVREEHREAPAATAVEPVKLDSPTAAPVARQPRKPRTPKLNPDGTYNATDGGSNQSNFGGELSVPGGGVGSDFGGSPATSIHKDVAPTASPVVPASPAAATIQPTAPSAQTLPAAAPANKVPGSKTGPTVAPGTQSYDLDHTQFLNRLKTMNPSQQHATMQKLWPLMQAHENAQKPQAGSVVMPNGQRVASSKKNLFKLG